MKNLNTLDWIALILVIIGGLNWGLIGFFNFNLVTTIFGAATLSIIVYDIVGLCALYLIFVVPKFAKK